MPKKFQVKYNQEICYDKIISITALIHEQTFRWANVEWRTIKNSRSIRFCWKKMFERFLREKHLKRMYETLTKIKITNRNRMCKIPNNYFFFFFDCQQRVGNLQVEKLIIYWIFFRFWLRWKKKYSKSIFSPRVEVNIYHFHIYFYWLFE